MSVGTLELSGGRLDLAVRAGRDGMFIIPTPSDLSAYAWVGQVRSDAGALIGAFSFTVTSSQASVLLPSAVTAQLPAVAQYEITLTGGDPSTDTTLLSGRVLCQAAVVQ